MNTQRTHTTLGIYLIALLAFLGVIVAFPAYAHEGHDHSVDTVATVTTGTTDVAKLEAMVKVLQQLVTLLTEYKKLYGTLPHTSQVTPAMHSGTAPVPPPLGVPVTVDEHVAHDASQGAKLVIELETHGGKTHVHVRYTDKPEEMFFVEAPLTDEDGIINAIITKTGMTKEVIQPALKYLE